MNANAMNSLITSSYLLSCETDWRVSGGGALINMIIFFRCKVV